MKWKKRDKTKWHSWFAWRPVKLNDGETIVWLEYVNRIGYNKRIVCADSIPVDMMFYQYKKWGDDMKSIRKEIVIPSIIWVTMVILVVLKALGVITLSWWWIFLPIWLPFTLVISMIGFVFTIMVACIIVVTILETLEK